MPNVPDEERRARLRAAYDRAAQERESSTLAGWKQQERAAFLAALKANGARTLLELGSGTGKDARWFADEGLDVTCTDLSPAMVQMCRAKGLRAHELDYAALDFADASFDGVYAMNCLLHLPKRDWREALDGIARVLAPRGLLYLGVYGGYDHDGEWVEDGYDPKRHFTFHTDEHVQRVAGEVFDQEDFHTVQSDPRSAALHFQALLLRKRGG